MKKKKTKNQNCNSLLKEFITWRNTQLPLSGCLEIPVKNAQQKYLQAHDEEKKYARIIKKKEGGAEGNKESGEEGGTVVESQTHRVYGAFEQKTLQSLCSSAAAAHKHDSE